MISVEKMQESPVLIKVFTGLPAEVFWQIVTDVEEKWPEYNRKRLKSPDRKRAVGGGRGFDLPISIRVALVLSYLRLHISQTAVACLYDDATQSDVSRELRRLLPLLAEVLPAPEVWEQIEAEVVLNQDELLSWEALSDGQVLFDATEQPVYRSEESHTRQAHYSGKKKQFTLKTQFVSDGEHYIIAISVSVPGATADKKLSDQVKTVDRLPDDCQAKADKGYQGAAKQVSLVTVINPETNEQKQVPRLTLETPFKKPRGGELTDEQKEFNQKLGSVRVRIEHCIGWVKNWAITSTRFRCDHSIYTLVMQVVCGLVNQQTHRWQAAKAQMLL
jgi:hypothetical protein